jgi:Mn2+/Fe2+ NRAMP family transporter
VKKYVFAAYRGLYPTMGREHLYTAVSLLGANVMPHSFYLHRCVYVSVHL